MENLFRDAEVKYESDYMQVKEILLPNGERARQVIQFAGRGKVRRALPARYEIYDRESNKWRKVEISELKA